ncbi:MAG: 3-hydroxyacyl-CoA dehydrogenase [Betaproteobacteria bacterium]|nr:3-hydroxyacyl-CoA dehydrogenase [Betaproteobacteria bacterium]
MSPIRFEKDASHIVTLTFDAPGAQVNTMSAAWCEALDEIVWRLDADKATIAGVILASAKKTFFAGAELNDIIQLKAEDGPAFFAGIERIKKSFRILERLGRPVVACLNGAALGGGWELALCAQHRICLDEASIQLGLPEVTLGLLPGGGGVTKMVRLLGLEKAFPFLVEGRLFGPREAAKLGLVHALASSPADMMDQARAWIVAHPTAKQPWDEESYRMPGGLPSTPRLAQALAMAPAMLVEKTRGLYPAPEAILAAVVEGAQVDVNTALRIETRYITKLACGQNAKNMITAFFFNMTAIRSDASRPKGEPRWLPGKVGILGAGMMGSGIAWANASRRIPCVLNDVSIDKAAAGKSYSSKLLARRMEDGRATEREAAATLALIEPTADIGKLAGCDLIIEAVFEQRALKAEVTKRAEPLLGANGIFASNTSTLPISGLAQASKKPANFIGLHFFSPVDKMRLVEIIKGEETSAATLAKAYDYVVALGKTPIVVNDSRGFFTSRVFGTFVREGAVMLKEGIAPAMIENAGKYAGMPVGPLAVIDETSMLLSLHVMEQTKADFAAAGQPYVAQPGDEVFERMVQEFKRPGRAGGGGFYDYPAEGRKSLWPGLAKAFGRGPADVDFEELKDRLLYRQAIETARCLEEDVLTTFHDANIGSILGIGFPAWTGGALQFINHVGARKFVQRAEALAKKHGPRFDPPAIVRDKAVNGELFR